MANFEARRIVRGIVDATVVEPVQQTARVARDSAQILGAVGIGVGRRIVRSDTVQRRVRRVEAGAMDLVTRGLDIAARVTMEVHAVRRRLDDKK